MSSQTDRPTGPALKRELKVADAAAFSVGLIGPVGVMALLGAGAVASLGAGVTWAFLLALVAVGLVAYGFVKLSRHVSHTGSLYALVGVTLGPRTGFVTGWALFFAYVTIGAGSGIEIGYFLDQLLTSLGATATPDWALVAVVAAALVALLATRRVHVVTRLLLAAELLGAGLVVVLDLVVVGRLAAGAAPAGQTLSWDFLSLPAGSGVGVIAGAAVLGFLAFAGFEGAAALGEETTHPRRDIPRALKIAIVVVGAFYLLTAATQSLGYGTDEASTQAYGANSAPYLDLGTAYVGAWFGDVLTLMAVVSLFAIFLGTLSGAARVLYALGRDSGARGGVARLSRTGAPTTALAVVIGLALATVLVSRLTVSSGVIDATFYALTVGTIALLVAYVLATVGAIRFLFFRGVRRAPLWEVVVPVLGLALVLYTVWRNVVGVEGAYRWFPPLVAAWLVVGVLVSLRRGLAERVRASLAAQVAAGDARLGLDGAGGLDGGAGGGARTPGLTRR